jgi:septum formation protein
VRLVLASASPARLAVLRGAGVDPVVKVSGVDEDALLAAMPGASPEQVVTVLARAKAEAVATHIGTEIGTDVGGAERDAVVVGCDSMLHIDGELVGKPGTAEAAVRRWKQMAGRSGRLITGHAVLRLDNGAAAAGAESTLVRFGNPSAQEIEAYVGTGEPLAVAGAFTLDGLGGWFVDGVDGDPSSIIGISLPLTRRLLAEVGVPVVALWSS